jgi:hypothetical protein
MIVVYGVLLGLAAVVWLGVVLWRHGRSPAPSEIEWEDVLAEAAKGGYRLITTGELARRY